MYYKSAMVTTIRQKQITIFVIAWLAYAVTYFLRKPIGIIKADIQKDLKITNAQLGWLDMALLLPYALMQMLFGSLGDKFGSRRMLAVNMIFSGLSMITFGAWDSFAIMLALLFLNGTAQATCWPNSVKLVSSWYPDKARNSVMGFYGTCAFVGGIVATALAVFLQDLLSWRGCFIVPSVVTILFGFLCYFTLYSPSELHMVIPGKDLNSSVRLGVNTNTSYWQLWEIPALREVAISVFCLKLVRYCMYMWLPLFLLDYLHYSKTQAGLYSTTFEIGGVFGSALLGVIIDKYYSGQSLKGCTTSSLLSAISFFLFYCTTDWGMACNLCFLTLAGAFNCGSDSILGGSLPNELGESDERNAGTAATGLVNGFGSIGTFMEGPIIGIVSMYFGWDGVFWLMIIMSLLGTLASFKAQMMWEQRHRIVFDMPLLPLRESKSEDESV